VVLSPEAIARYEDVLDEIGVAHERGLERPERDLHNVAVTNAHRSEKVKRIAKKREPVPYERRAWCNRRGSHHHLSAVCSHE